jgi:hypothetical protein
MKRKIYLKKMNIFPFGYRFVRNRIIVVLMFGIKGGYSATDIRARTPDRLCHGATHGHDTGRNKPICSNSATRLRDPCLLIGRKWPAWGTLACVRSVVPPNGDPIPYIYEGI